MWIVEEIDKHNANTAYLVKNDRTGGYLATNNVGGGALHFDVESDAEEIAELLNGFQVR